MNVMVVAAHPDDESIGCGGSICLHRQRGDRVTAVFLTSGELGLKELPVNEARRVREAEAEEAAARLGLAQTWFLRLPDWFVADAIDDAAASLRALVGEETPDRIYVPHPEEQHPDHSAAATAVDGAVDDVPVWRYEVWTPMARYDEVTDVTAAMARKLDAIRSYRSQLRAFRYDRAITGLNQFRGELAGRCDFAEVFSHHDTGP